MGKRIKDDVLFNRRAEYGQQVVKRLADRLVLQFGLGWKDRKLFHCIRAAYTFTEDEIVYAARIQLTWTHLRAIMFVEEPLARQFYIEMTRIEHWDTRTLTDKSSEPSGKHGFELSHLDDLSAIHLSNLLLDIGSDNRVRKKSFSIFLCHDVKKRCCFFVIQIPSLTIA